MTQPEAAVTALASGQVTDWTQPLAWVKAHSSLDPSFTEMPQLDPVFQTPPRPLPAAFSIPESLHTTSLTPAARIRPHPTTKMDRWMQRWTVTGFQHLQRADSQAPMPGAPPRQRLLVVEALMGRPAPCRRPRGRALGWPWHCGPQARWAKQKQHSMWDRYTHISLTLSQVTQSRTERNKNKELVSPQRRREQAPHPGPSGRGH